MATLRIPTPLRPYAGGQSEIEVPAQTVAEALDGLTARHPALRKHLYTDSGDLRSFVNIFLNEEDVRHLQGVHTVLQTNDRLIIIPSIAGGV